MISSRPIVNVEFLLQSTRITGRVQLGPAGLFGLFNDAHTSVVEVEEAYCSRLSDPARIVANYAMAQLSKVNIALVVVARREELGPQGLARGGYTRMNAVPALLSTAVFDVKGDVEVPGQLDAAELLVGGTGRFIIVYNACATVTAQRGSHFTGEAILVNRGLVEVVTATENGQGD